MLKDYTEIQYTSPILENTIKIVRTRLRRTKFPWYINFSLKNYLKIDSIKKGLDNDKDYFFLDGYIAEGLFYTIISDILNKDIQISSGIEDIKGTDFLIEGRPFNVTTNTKILDGKFRNNRPPNIILPTNKGQTLFNNIGSNIPYVVDLQNNNFPYEKYFEHTLGYNYSVLREMDYQLNNCCSSSPLFTNKILQTNYDQLEDILTYLSTS